MAQKKTAQSAHGERGCPRNAVRNGAEWAGGVGRFYCRWAEIGPGIGPQEKAENTGDFSENEPNGPVGPILGGREGKAAVGYRERVYRKGQFGDCWSIALPLAKRGPTSFSAM